MRTNRGKYAHYYGILTERAQRFIDEILPVKPERFFEIGPKFQVVERPVCSIGYTWRYPDKRNIYEQDKPSRLMVETIKVFCESNPSCSRDEVFLYWSMGGLSGAERLSKIDGASKAWTAEELASEIERRRQLYEPREGYIACSYCRQQRLPADIIYDTIISPNWKHRGYKSPPRPYCKDKPCAGYDQMAHEG